MSGLVKNGSPGADNMYMWEDIGLLPRIPAGLGFPDIGSITTAGGKYGYADTGEEDKRF